MKLRILENLVRLRLTSDEVKQFLESGEVGGQTRFGGSDSFIYKLRKDENAERMTAAFLGNTLEVVIPKESADRWAASSDEIGLEEEQKITEGESLFILVEKDFKGG